MAEIARTKTFVTPDQVADELADQLKVQDPSSTREQAALLLAQLMLETANGTACYNFNVGNITSNENGAFYRPVWWTVDDQSSPRLKELHAAMLKGQAPRAFRAYSTLSAGVGGYLRELTLDFPSLLEASKTGDAQQFADAIRTSRYAPDAQPGTAQSVASMQSKYLQKGMFASLPPLDDSVPALPALPEEPDSCC